jgi:hypothetical protein
MMAPRSIIVCIPSRGSICCTQKFCTSQKALCVRFAPHSFLHDSYDFLFGPARLFEPSPSHYTTLPLTMSRVPRSRSPSPEASCSISSRLIDFGSARRSLRWLRNFLLDVVRDAETTRNPASVDPTTKGPGSRCPT